MIPPVVGPATVAMRSSRMRSTMPPQSNSVFFGHWSTQNFSRYIDECLPDERRKCPSRSAPTSRKIRSTSAEVTMHRQYPASVEGPRRDAHLTSRDDDVAQRAGPDDRASASHREGRQRERLARLVRRSHRDARRSADPLHRRRCHGDQLPLDALVGPCVVVEHTGASHVDGEWLGAHVPAKSTRVLVKTRNSRIWDDPNAKFTRDFIAVNASGARWCVQNGIRLIGIDSLSIEPQGPEKEGYPAHKTLLAAGIVIIEGLDLRAVSAGSYELVCAPLKIAGGDGAPARVFLIER